MMLSENVTDPNFTPSFEERVLLIPCLFLWVFAPLNVYYIKKSKLRCSCYERTVLKLPWLCLWILSPLDLYYIKKSRSNCQCQNWMNWLKLVTLDILVACCVLEVGGIAMRYKSTQLFDSVIDVFSPFLQLITFVLVYYLVDLNTRKGLRSSGVIFLFWLLDVILGVPHFWALLCHKSQSGFLLVHCVKHLCMIISLILNFFAEPGYTLNQPLNEDKRCPEKMSSFPSRMMFTWVSPLIQKGLRNTLKFSDLWILDPENTLTSSYYKFYKQWLRGIKSSSVCEYSVFWPLVQAFGPTFLFAAFLRLLYDVLVFLEPYLIMELFAYINHGQVVWKGFFYIGLLLSNCIVKNIVQQQKDYRIRLVDMRVQSALYSAIYKKTLKISQLFHQTKLAGGVVNLLTNDVQQLITFIFYFNNAWSAPLQITIAFIILWHILGMAMVAGVVALVVAVTISLCTSYVIKIFQSKHLMMKDHRLKLMHEVLLCMKAIKLNAWESSFEEKFNKIQKRETTYLKKLHFFRTASNLIWNACNFVVPFCSYYWYVKFEGRELDTETALKAYLYFMLLPAPLYFLPNVLVEYSESGASLERINNFLNANEMTGDQVQHDDSESDSIVIENGTFSWGRSVEAVLHNVTLRVKPGSLVAVVGSMGSGKSSLLSATLGEMETISGHINVKGSVAYVPQQAWIQNTTVKDNILFGNKYREDWYRSVVTACALDPDIRLLPAHHHTKIGDQGMNLSGGQKQRISLARAVYMLLDLYLLDDILSSFDAVVGRQIFEHVIGPQGLLKEKTRIFITHSLTHLRNVDIIVYLKDGTIAETPGTYDQLMSREGPFFKFVSINDKQQTTVDDLMPVLENQGDLMEQKTETNPYTSCTEEPKDSNRKPEKVCLLESEENTEIGRVKLSVYLNYLKSSCSLILFCVFLLVTHHWLIFSGLQLIDCWGGQHMYVTFHDNGSCTVDSLFFDRCIGDLDERCTTSLIINVTNSINEDESPSYSSLDKLIGFTNSSNEDIFPSDSRMRSSHIFPNGSNDDKSLSDWNLSILTVFSAAGLLSAMLMFIVEFLVIRNLLNASLRIHKEMLRGVLFAPLSFLNSSPVGQVITRFSHDINILDYSLPREFCMFLFCVTGIIFILTSMMYTVKGLAYFLVPVFVIYILLLLYYLATNRQLKRHEVLCHSSINSLLSESYQGTSSIRAFKVQERFEKKFDTRVDLLLVFWYHFTVVTMWLNVWLESLGITVLILTSLYGVINRSAVLMGEERRRFDSILLLFATSMINCFMNSVRAAGKIETNIVSVERTKEYRDLQPEEGNKDKRNCSKSEEKKPTDWPSRGKLEVRHLSVRYRENQAFILKDIDFSVEPGQKIGIVGRTGAGKSTLALALFGVIKPENGRGHIIIDDIDITSLPLKKLRSSLSIIPQDPVLFTGTLRMNLDPTETKTDPEIKEALRKVEALQEFVFHHGLDFAITDAGANLSVGQKQVICLVRALLHKSKLLIMDEATASVDLKMDQLIHKTIREEFRDSTVLIIAHRLNTVLESDKVMVIVNGQIQEFDTPNNLLNDNNSFFHTMAQNANLIGNGNVNGD